MERDDRAPVATFYCASPLAAGARVPLSEATAHHARVRRLAVGDPVRLTNGAGTLARAHLERIARAALDVAVLETTDVPPPPELRLVVPVADRDRMLWLAEKCAELAVSAWVPVLFQRSRGVSPRGEGEGFGRKVLARMTGALEQSGGAWLPLIRAEREFEGYVRTSDHRAMRILLDRDGESFAELPIDAPLEIVVGPEGGLDPAERAALVDRGWRLASLGETTLRFETAGIVAAGIARARLRR